MKKTSEATDYTDVESVELTLALVERDSAWNAAVHRYASGIERTAQRVIGRTRFPMARPSDMIQKTFAIAVKNRHSLGTVRCLRAFFNAICEKLCREVIRFEFRAKRDKRRTEGNIGLLGQADRQSDDPARCVEALDVLQSEIRKLNPKQRKIYDLTCVERLSDSEVARQMHLTTDTIRRYRAKFRFLLEEQLKQ